MQDRLGDKVRLLHIVDAVNEIENYIDGVDLDHFVKNSMMFNASLRQLEIIGEAVIDYQKKYFWIIRKFLGHEL